MTNTNSQTKSQTIETAENSITIAMATTPAEKKQIYHFRYQIYVNEMSKHIASVDNRNKLLYDELDKWTFLLHAKIGSTIIGTARVNIGTLADFPQKLVEFLALDKFQTSQAEHHNFAYVTKLMVAPSHRNSPVLYLLLAKCYELCHSSQVEFVFGACNFHLLRLYEQIGFHRYSKNFVDPGYGLLAPIVFLLNDIEHLRTIRSPFFRIARKKRAVNTQATQWFHNELTKYSNIINSQIITEEELWSVLQSHLLRPPTEAITILRELSEIEAKKFLHCCGSFIQCDPGSLITNQGDVSYSYNILISGKLQSLTFLCPIKEYNSPGQHFGANGLTEHTKHTEDITAIDAVEIFTLSGIAFQKFFHSSPTIAHKIVKNIARLRKDKALTIRRY